MIVVWLNEAYVSTTKSTSIKISATKPQIDEIKHQIN